ncbi:MAG: hypothetical protein A2Y34_02420 [Spirochaetes bacterium GWC1_27_15]|nr:MAG: hypothetical protein A2Z98_02700 [Spirochaetes bacterium GWB1_27_13]OHD26045.1 MAG: hypothetical protein A2Y34_02420 [Spirochaetes bacterium GWC1_27_15]
MKIGIIDDDKIVRFSISELLKNITDEIYQFESGEDFLEYLKSNNVDLAIIDYQLKGINGLQLLKEIKINYQWIEVVLITGFGSEKIAIEAIKSGAYDYIAKPFNNEEFLNRVNHIKEKIKLEDNAELFGSYFSPSMKSIVEKVKTLSKTDIPILITGESGTGKELIAKIVHYYSGRTGKFLAINCSSIPANLVESELFGAEKGSFTGANTRKIGFFEIANEGSLFLDEVGEIPYGMQAKLLRTIQESEIMRIGGGIPIKINTRIIAATNRDVEEEILNKKFRDDLFYRLNVGNIKIPPLRNRKEDIKPLAYVFLNEFNKKYKKNILGFSSTLLDSFLSYSWHGNIRELKNKIEEAFIFCNGDYISEQHLNLNILNSIKQTDSKKNNYNFSFDINELPEDLVEAKKIISNEFEKKFILYHLSKNNYNVNNTAQNIGLYRQELYKKIKILNIELP